MELKNKTAIVTGAGQGIGFEICRNLAKAGANVILNDIDPELAKHAANTINEEYHKACIEIPGDSSDLILSKKWLTAQLKRMEGWI